MVDAGMADAQLVQAVRAGDGDALAAIFDRYAPRIHAFCARVLNEPHTAADATQDTFVTAARRLDQLRDPTKLRPWLYAIARNECTRHGRARDRAVPLEEAAMTAHLESVPGADETADAAGSSEVGALLWAAAEGLDEKDRALLELQLRHGLEGRELAEAAGVPAGQLSMATGRLRDRVERAVGALLVARRGRPDCPGLRVVLDGWDGTFSVLMRKRVARHVDRCDTCEQTRSVLVAPLGTLALVPGAVAFSLADLPAGLRERTLAEAGAHLGGPPTAELEPWPDGFPPADRWDADVGGIEGEDGGDEDGADLDDLGEVGVVAGASSSRPGVRRAVPIVVVAVVALIALVGVAVVRAGDAGDDVVADLLAAAEGEASEVGASSSTLVERSGNASTTPGTAVDALAETSGDGDGGPEADEEAPLAPAPEVPPPTTAPPLVPAPAPLPGPAPAPAPGPAPTSPAPAPNQPPSVGATSSSGDASLQLACNPDNRTRTISVTVTDDRGVAGVVLRWNHSVSGSGERAMVRSGTTWTAVLGPFDDLGQVTYRAVATDVDGASASSPTRSVTVDPCAG